MTSEMPSPLVPAQIAKNTLVPYYAQLCAILKSAIQAGTFAPGQLLPSEADLGAEYGLSRTAVRQALGLLALEGLVRREKGRGTFVSRADSPALVLPLDDVLRDAGSAMRVTVISVRSVVVPPAEAAHLQVPTGSSVVQMDGVYVAGDEPFRLSRWLLPLPRYASLLDIEGAAAAEWLLHADTGPIAGTHRLQAVAADAFTARHLRVEVGAPVLQVAVVELDQGRPVRSCVSHYVSTRVSLQMHMGPRPDQGR